VTLLRELTAPVVTTLHTVLRTPNADSTRNAGIDRPLNPAGGHDGAGQTILQEVYRRHGKMISSRMVFQTCIRRPGSLQGTVWRGGKRCADVRAVVAEQGIEQVLNALPISCGVPDVVYIVLGATHPNELRARGDTYRLGLEAIVGKNQLENHVIFHNRFVELKELTEFIGAADLYITLIWTKPRSRREHWRTRSARQSRDLDAVLACRRIVGGAACVLVPFADPAAIAREVRGLLRDETRRNAMSDNAYKLAHHGVEQDGGLYMRSFELARRQAAAAPRESVARSCGGGRLNRRS